MTLTEWLIDISEADVAPTVDSMRRRAPRSGEERIKTARRADKHVDHRSDHEIAAERHREQHIYQTSKRSQRRHT